MVTTVVNKHQYKVSWFCMCCGLYVACNYLLQVF